MPVRFMNNTKYAAAESEMQLIPGFIPHDSASRLLLTAFLIRRYGVGALSAERSSEC